MASSERTASDYARQAVKEVDPDGGGFHTSEAVDHCYRSLLADGLFTPEGRPTVAAAQFLRAGATQFVKQYRPFKVEAPPTREFTPAEAYAIPRAAVAVAADSMMYGQTDLAELSEEFSWMLEGYAALDETRQATRKQYMRLNYEEVCQVIALKMKKANQTIRAAQWLQDVINRHRDWPSNPALTLGDIFGLPNG